MSQAMRVLVMQQKMIGDVLTSSVLCGNLRRHLPGAQVHFLAHDGARAVLQGNPHIDVVHSYPARSAWRDRRRVARRLRDEGFDAVIDVYGKWESLQLVAACRAGRSIGYRKWYTRAIYTDPVRRNSRSADGVPLAIEHRLQLLAPLLGDVDRDSLATRPKLYVEAAEHDAARAFLAHHHITATRPLLMVAALGSEPRKTYPLAAMARLLDRIVQRCDAQMLFNHLPAQRDEAEALYGLCAAATRARIALDAYPRGLREFIAVLAQCDGLFGNEGGAVNMARALDVPSFSIFSPWISTGVWGINDDGRHPAVHLGDFAPELTAGRASGDLKRRAADLYAAFDPAMIEPALDRYIVRLSESFAS